MTTQKLLNLSKKGMVGKTVTIVIGAAITIFIGIWVISLTQGSISQTGWSTEANATYATVTTTTWNSINLLAVGLVVMAAVLILAYFNQR